MGEPVAYGRRLAEDAIKRERAAGVSGIGMWWLDGVLHSAVVGGAVVGGIVVGAAVVVGATVVVNASPAGIEYWCMTWSG